MSSSGRMKNGQSAEVDFQPMDVSIGNSPEPCDGGPVLMGSIPKELRGTVAGH